MKANLHPNYVQTTVTCACGNTIVTGSTVKDLKVDICSKCHPFYTGEHRFVDILGRVDKFMAKRQAASTSVVSKKKAAKKGQKLEKQAKPLTLKEMLTVTKTEKASQAA